MTDQERAIIEAAKALADRLNSDGEWYDDNYGYRACIVCGSHENGIHDVDCELVKLMNIAGKTSTSAN